MTETDVRVPATAVPQPGHNRLALLGFSLVLLSGLVPLLFFSIAPMVSNQLMSIRDVYGFTWAYLGLPFDVTGIVVAHIALVRSRRDRLTGANWAITTLVLGYVGTGIWLLLMIFILIMTALFLGAIAVLFDSFLTAWQR